MNGSLTDTAFHSFFSLQGAALKNKQNKLFVMP